MNAPLDLDHPWPGPDSFRTEDAAFFRGRSGEIEQLLQLVRRARSVVLYGASGLGKTSLVNAGLVPRLPAEQLFAVPVRISYGAGAGTVGEQLQAEIIRRRGVAGAPALRPGRTAWEYLHLRDEPIAGAQPLVILDQFEELFTIGQGTPQAAELVEELKGLIEGIPPRSVSARLERAPAEARALSFQRHGHRVLIGIREDYLYGLESLRAEIPSLIHDRFRIGPLSGASAMEVVTQRGPGAALGPGERPPLVEAEVAELIVRTVASARPDERPLEALEVEPALLSILCTELSRRRAAGTPITRELVRGSRSDIIAGFYARSLEDVPPAVRRYVEDALVTSTGYRTSAVLAEALAVPGFTGEVLSRLVGRRLLRVTERQSGKWLELTHDVLTEFAVRGRARRLERAREARRRKRALLVVGTLLGVLAAAWATEAVKRRAADELRRALRRQVVTASLRDARYREALAQLAATVREEPDAAWARALLGDLLVRRAWPRPEPPLFEEGPFSYLTCNRRGTRCAAAYRDGRVAVRGDLSRDLSTGHSGYGTLFMSTDGARLVFTPEKPGTGHVWTLDDPGASASFPVEATWTTWCASDDARTVVLPLGSDLLVWRFGAAAPSRPQRVQRRLGNAPFALSNDGVWLAYETLGERIELRNLQTGTTRELPTPGGIVDLAVHPAGNALLAVLAGGTLRSWSVPEGRELPAPRADRPVTAIQYSTTGDALALVLQGGGVELWSPGWEKPRRLVRTSAGVRSLSFAPDDGWLAPATRDGVVSLWDASGAPLGEPLRHDGMAYAQALDHRGLLSVSLGGDSARWTVAGPLRGVTTLSLGEPVQAAWFVADDALFAYGRSSALDHRLGQDPRPQPLARASLQFSPDRRAVATFYTDGFFVREGLPRQAFSDEADVRLLDGPADSASFSGDGRRLVVVGAGAAQVFELPSGRPLGAPIADVAGAWLNADGSLLATKKSDVGLTLWRCDGAGSATRLADIDALEVSRVAFEPGGRSLLVAVANQARVWSVRDRRFTGAAVAHRGQLLDVEFSPDGRAFATASDDGRARIWDTATGLPASDWFEQGGAASAVSFSPSGRSLLTASTDGEIRIWGLGGIADATDRERLRLAELAELVSGLRVDPGTGELVTAPHVHEAFAALRREVARECPGGAADPPPCASPVNALVRELVGSAPAAAPQPAASR